MNRLTEKEVESIKKLRKTKTVDYLAKKFNVSASSISYHCNPKYKERVKRLAREWFNALPEKKKHEVYSRNYYGYGKYYMKARYNGDPEFKIKVRSLIDENKRKHREYILKNHLCRTCYKELEKGNKYLSCSKCRKKQVEVKRCQAKEKAKAKKTR